MNSLKILVLDIETAPNVAYVWRFFKENVGANQVLEHCSVLSFGAKWLGEKKLIYYDTQKLNEGELLSKLNILLDEADAVVAHAGSGFDMPKIRGRSLVHGISPSSPVKEIDTYKIAKKEFGFDSNSLAYLADVLGCDRKGSHGAYPGFELWAACLAGDKNAWKVMKDYNLQDVNTLEQVYYKMLPYIKNHPNMGVFMEREGMVCPKCGSVNSQRRGFAYTNVGKYQRYQCNDCGGWHRTRFTEYDKDKRETLAVNVAT